MTYWGNAIMVFAVNLFISACDEPTGKGGADFICLTAFVIFGNTFSIIMAAIKAKNVMTENETRLY